MLEIMDKITQIITDYYESDVHYPEGLLTMNKELTANIFFLEKHRNDYHTKYEKVIYNAKNQGAKVNAAENDAKIEVPELYQLRRFMEAAERVSIQIGVHISWLKSELNATARDNS